MNAREENGVLVIELSGRIDTGNAPEIERELAELAAANPGARVVFDAKELEYISSAGLRLLLHARKNNPEITIINVGDDVYEIFEVTGFSQMFNIERKTV